MVLKGSYLPHFEVSQAAFNACTAPKWGQQFPLPLPFQLGETAWANARTTPPTLQSGTKSGPCEFLNFYAAAVQRKQVRFREPRSDLVEMMLCSLALSESGESDNCVEID